MDVRTSTGLSSVVLVYILRRMAEMVSARPKENGGGKAE